MFYSGWSVNADQEYNDRNGWNREHVWSKSHGNFEYEKRIGTDLHNLKPTDITVNSAKQNKDFDNGGFRYIDGDGRTDCRSDSDSWEPRDEVKGDVARILFYMAVRYEGENGEPDLELVNRVNTHSMNEKGKGYYGKLKTLLKWHEADPVDSFEINRNNVIFKYQKNRNPFIDHPEFVEIIW